VLQISQLQKQIEADVQLHEQQQCEVEQHKLVLGSELEAAQLGFHSHTAQLEAELAQTQASQQQKLAELHGMLASAREERDQLSAAMQLLSRAAASPEECSAMAGTAAVEPVDGTAGAAVQHAASLAAAMQRLHTDVSHLTAAAAAPEGEAGSLKQQLQEAQLQHEQEQQQLQVAVAQAHEQLSSLPEQYDTVEALAKTLAEQLEEALQEAAADSADKQSTIEQLQQQLAAQETKLAELSLLTAAAQEAADVAERRLSQEAPLTEARVAELSAVLAGPEGPLVPLDQALGVRHASQGTTGSVSTVTASVVLQPTPGSNLMPLLQSPRSFTSAAVGDASAAAELAEVSALLAQSRQEAARKAQEVDDLSRRLDIAQGMLSTLEEQMQVSTCSLLPAAAGPVAWELSPGHTVALPAAVLYHA